MITIVIEMQSKSNQCLRDNSILLSIKLRLQITINYDYRERLPYPRSDYIIMVHRLNLYNSFSLNGK